MTIDSAHSTRRPARIAIHNWNGTTQTLPSGNSAYDILSGGPEVLLLGCGPLPLEAAVLAEKHVTGTKLGGVSYVECADFASQMPQKWHKDIPANWTPAVISGHSSTKEHNSAPQSNSTPSAELIRRIRRCVRRGDTIIIYRQNARLFPDFWGPLLAVLQLERLCVAGGVNAEARQSRSVILAGSPSDLLVHELHHAFASQGMTVQTIEPDDAAALPSLLQKERPDLFACVNFKGLDAWGERFHLLQAAQIPVAVWCVDNPWHLLSGIKAPFWKQLHLFITDHSFINPLKRHGAKQVVHLPLATMPQLFSPAGSSPAELSSTDQAGATHCTTALPGQLIFVGRSAFPDKQRFFAGCNYPPEIMNEALQNLTTGARPHYDWWCAKMKLSSLWPEKNARQAGFAAEETAQAWRTNCLTACAEQLSDKEFAVYGDEGWHSLLPQRTAIHPPVDYYTQLPTVYSAACGVLNLTSMLLPAGLTQRNFDVWAADGFCLTDATAGLSVFPDELVREVSFKTAADIVPLFRRAIAEPAWRRDIIQAWRTHILAHHTYEHRVQTIMTACGLK
ncbi:glycosyltransferase family protein [Oleidesulfovibrio sp.]|uniref:glycosyltransferase family protein n=1 Tax=Oleidesulfovibrio sp. TaxID=2909707 RepID=UPI003A8711E2